MAIKFLNAINVDSGVLYTDVVNNRVGIGTTSPATKLEIHGNNSARNTLQNILTINGGTNSNNVYSGFGMGLNFNGRDYSNQPRDYAYIYGVQEASSTSTPGGDPGFTSQLTFYTNTGGAVNTLPTQKMVITAAGNVGIGTTSPQMGLHVADTRGALFGPSGYGTASSYFSPSDENTLNGGYGLDTDTADIWLNYRGYQDGFTRFRDTRIGNGKGSAIVMVNGSTGNVGIGTTSPAQKLQVNGSVYSNGGEFFVNTNSGITAVGNLIFKGHNGTSYFEGMRLSSSGNVGIGTTSPGAKLEVAGDTYITGRDFGKAVNYATSQGWLATAAGFTSQVGYFGGNFNIIGDAAENTVAHGINPWGSKGLLWTTINDVGDNADGGWQKLITQLPSDDLSYISVNYVKRNAGTATGNYYHGCDGGNTLNMDGTANTNPYFFAQGTQSLPADVWCVSIGVIQGNNDSSTGTAPLTGIYRIDTGEKVAGGTSFKMKNGSTQQVHRSFLYYATDTTTNLSYCNPGFFAVDGTEPTLGEIIGGGGSTNSLWSASGNDVYKTNASGNVGIGTTSPATKLDVDGVITATGGNSTEWNTAYDNSITTLAVSGTTTKTLTATQQDGGTLTASWTDNNTGGTVTSVSGTGTVSGITLTGTVTSTGNLTLGGTLSASITNISNAANWWNNFGQTHGTRTGFDASTASYDFGWRYIQGNTNGPGTGGAQFYSAYVGLGSDYSATGGGSYGMYLAIDRNITNPYLSIRYNESNTLGTWKRISAGTADILTTARTIAGVSFNGSANISLNNNAITNGAGYITSYVNTTYSAGSGLSLTGTVFANTAPNIVQTTVTGNAGSATVLQTARTINGVSFNGSANITIGATDSTKLPLAGGTMTGLLVGKLNTATTVEASDDTGSFSVRGDTTKPAAMSFHRAGAYAVNFGLSTANKMELGGWSAGSIKHTWDMSGNYFAVGSINAPIFYDSDNTGYYLDPASTSNLNTVTAAQFNGPLNGNATTATSATTATNVGGLTPNMIVSGGSGRKSTYVTSFSGASETSGFYYGNNMTGAPTTDWANYIQAAGDSWATGNNYSFQLTHAFHSDNFWVSRMTNGSQSAARLILDAGSTDQTKTGILQSDSSLRAPIFYDSNNTGYYIDGASTSSLNSLNVNALDIGGGNIAVDEVKGFVNSGAWTRNATPYGFIDFGPANTSFAHIYTDRPSFYFNKTVLVLGGSEINQSDIRTNIFYDLDNTGYYLNPASTSNLSTVTAAQFNGPLSGNASSSSASTKLDTAYVGGQQTNPQVYFNNSTGLRAAMTGAWSVWSDTLWINGYSGGDVLQMCALHTLRNGEPRIAISVQASTATSYGSFYEIITEWSNSQTKAGIFQSNASLRAPIFYDSNNTGYYLDPAGTSSLNQIDAGVINGSDIYASGWLRNNTSGLGLYNQATGNHWYSDGAYWNVGYNGDTGIRLRNGYNGTVLGTLYAQTNGHFGLLDNDGHWAVHIQTGNSPLELRCNNNVQFQVYDSFTNSPGSSRAPIFYDSDNTGYYLDPASTSNVNVITAAGTMTATNFILSSDERKKTKIKDLSCDNIDISWKSFEMKSDEGEYRVGVIAQELEIKHPEFVNTDNEGFKSVKYIDLLIAKIAELEARLEKAGL